VGCGYRAAKFHLGVQGILAVSERPGGSPPCTAEFDATRSCSVEASRLRTRYLDPAGDAELSAYFEHALTASHYALRGGTTAARGLEACYLDLANSMSNKTMVLLHSDEVSDRLLGVIAGYLVWGQRVPTVPLADRLRRTAVQAIDWSGRSNRVIRPARSIRVNDVIELRDCAAARSSACWPRSASARNRSSSTRTGSSLRRGRSQ